MYLNINSECKYTHNYLINKLPRNFFLRCGAGTVFDAAAPGSDARWRPGRQNAPFGCEKFHNIINSCYLYDGKSNDRYPKGFNDD